MHELNLFQLVILPIGLGLLGFVEPCSIGSSLVFIKYVEGQSAATRIAQVGVFALTRALFIGVLGAFVGLIGTIFLSLQKGAWLLLGVLYIAVGAFYAFGKAGFLMRSFGPSLSRLMGLRGSIGLGLLFGLNIPACAAPLIFALLGAAALGGSGGGTVVLGFVSLGLFGLALFGAAGSGRALAARAAPARPARRAVGQGAHRDRPRPDRTWSLVGVLRLARRPGGLVMHERDRAPPHGIVVRRPARQMGPTFWKIASAGRGEEPASPIDVYVGVAVMDLGAENPHERL